MSICLSVYLRIFLSVYLAIYVYLSINLSVYLFIHLSIYLSTCLPIHLAICLSVYLPICLSVYYMSICLFSYISCLVSGYFTIPRFSNSFISPPQYVAIYLPYLSVSPFFFCFFFRVYTPSNFRKGKTGNSILVLDISDSPKKEKKR